MNYNNPLLVNLLTPSSPSCSLVKSEATTPLQPRHLHYQVEVVNRGMEHSAGVVVQGDGPDTFTMINPSIAKD